MSDLEFRLTDQDLIDLRQTLHEGSQDMEDDDATEIALAQWEKSFREDALTDNYRIFKLHLQSLDLPDDPSLLLEGTIVFVQMCVAYLTLDNQAFISFLDQQRYDLAKVVDAPYLVTFDIHGKAYARVILPASLRPVDLADLYGAPWDDYRVVGYCDIWISRIDGVPLSDDEMSAFEKVVDCDLRFDYCEDELSFWFDPDTHDGILKVTLQDVYDDELQDLDDENEDGEQEPGGKPHD